MADATAAAETRRRYGVPETVRLEVLPHMALAWVDGAENAVRCVAAEPDDLPSAGGGRRGRGGLFRLDSPLGALVVREHRKGGLLRKIRGKRFHGRWRPLDEMVVTRRLAAAGVPVPEAVGAVVLRRGATWRGFLLTREVEDGVDLEAWLYGRSGLPAGRRDVLPRAGEAVRRLHDAGVSHADLHPKNLLLDPHADRILVIDLDRARAFDGPLPSAQRVENLVRLGRAVEKHRLRGMHAGRRDALRFLEGYAGSREEAEQWLDRVRARLSPGLKARVLWWKVTGQARATP